jgi:hypothetical protein
LPDINLSGANPIVARTGSADEIEVAYLDFGFFGQSMLVCVLAGRRAESHLPISVHDKAHLLAAVIASQTHSHYPPCAYVSTLLAQ